MLYLYVVLYSAMVMTSLIVKGYMSLCWVLLCALCAPYTDATAAPPNPPNALQKSAGPLQPGEVDLGVAFGQASLVILLYEKPY